MKRRTRFIARSFTIGIAFLTACQANQPQSTVQSIQQSATTSTDIQPHSSPIIGENVTNQQSTPAPSASITPMQTQEPASASFLTPSPSLSSTSTPSSAPPPSDTVSSTPTPVPSTVIEQTPVPSPGLSPTPSPTPIPTPKPTPTPTPIPTPTPTPHHTFTRLSSDSRFEEYSFLLSKPPGIKLENPDASTFIRQISVEQQTGDIIGLWNTYDQRWYLNEYNLFCIDPQNNDCFEWPAYFLYDTQNDHWLFLRDLNTNGVTSFGTDKFGHAFTRSYIWWYLNRNYQTSIVPIGDDPNNRTGIILRHDMAQKRFWVVQMNDMPSNANGDADGKGAAPGIPYPPVLVGPDGWVGPDAYSRGYIALQNAMTYSKHGLYFFESENPDFHLRIHYYSLELPVSDRVWTTKSFVLKTGSFRANFVMTQLEPQVAYSKKDDHLYFLNRMWWDGSAYAFTSLMRIRRTDAIP